MCQGGCGELDRPPSASNMSIWAIIELVAMGVCALFCLMELINLFNSNADLSDVWTILTMIDDALIVIGLILVVYGLFCAGAGMIRSGILCFVIGCIIELVILIYRIVKGEHLTFYGFCYIVLLIILAYILWRQSGHL